MATGERTFVLTGAYAGKSVTLGHPGRMYPFVEGRMTMADDLDVLDKVGIYISRCWQAWPEGSKELKECQERDRLHRGETHGDSEPKTSSVQDEKQSVQSDVSPSGEGTGKNSSVSSKPDDDNPSVDGDNTKGSRSSPEDIAEAVRTLDPLDDSHWTVSGLPKVDVVNDLLDNADFGRAEIEEAIPGFNREKVQSG